MTTKPKRRALARRHFSAQKVVDGLVAKANKVGYPLVVSLHCASCTPGGWTEHIADERTLREHLDCPVFANVSAGKTSRFTFKRDD